ncbi:hypothetical protein GGR53DRAFT_494243 [Hypoxylon sp. FL1150]|nr:hypothetical protein GGR53DRAFT_494243 [Hypoxylon sp. FL1150]
MSDQIIRYDSPLRSFKDILDQFAAIRGVEEVDTMREALRFIEDRPLSLRVDQKWITWKHVNLLHGQSFQAEQQQSPQYSGDAPRDLDALKEDIEALHQLCISSEPPTWRFPKFRKLHREIRKMIWDYATPPRFVCVQSNGLRCVRYDAMPGGISLPPATAQVCRESRRIACRHGRNVPILKAAFRSPPDSEPSDPDDSGHAISQPYEIPDSDTDHSDSESSDDSYLRDAKPQLRHHWGWFDPSRDSLVVSLCSSIPPIVANHTQHVTLDPSLFGDGPDVFFPLLKSIEYVAWQHRLGAFNDPVLEARLFGGNFNFFHVDASDYDALVKRVEKDHSSDELDRLRTLSSDLSSMCADRAHRSIEEIMRPYHDVGQSCPTLRNAVRFVLSGLGEDIYDAHDHTLEEEFGHFTDIDATSYPLLRCVF